MALAQLPGNFSTPPSNVSSTTTIPTAEIHVCLVGKDGLTFTPNQISAEVGDIIEYRFYGSNYSVARAAFGNNLACLPYEDNGPDLVGFWSGANASNAVPDPPAFRVRINDTQPVFFYCPSSGACQTGMIGVINPNSTFTYQNQLAYALNTSVSVTPDPSLGSDASISKYSTAASLDSPNGPASTLSALAIAWISIAAAIIGITALTSLYLCVRGRRRINKRLDQNSQDSSLRMTYLPNSSQVTYSGSQIHDLTPTSTDVRGLAHPGLRQSLTSPFDRSSGVPPPHELQRINLSPVYAPVVKDLDIEVSELRPYMQNSRESLGPHELHSEQTTRPFSFVESDRGGYAEEQGVGRRGTFMEGGSGRPGGNMF